MKKNYLLAGYFLLAVASAISCNKTDMSPTPTSAGTTAVKTKPGTILAKGKGPCPDCYDHTATGFQGINTETALMMSNNYKNINQPLLEISPGNPDANSIWFSLETLKNFIWKIEEASCDMNCPTNLNLGIRIYYARYPVDVTSYNDLSDLVPEFSEHHTLFMVPTYQDPGNSQVHWDFDPWHWGNECYPKSMRSWFSTSFRPFGAEKSLIFSVGENQYFRNADGTLSSALNHGGLIPPYPIDGTGY